MHQGRRLGCHRQGSVSCRCLYLVYNGAMSRIEHAVLPAGAVSLAFFGVAFARSWLSLVFVEPGSMLGVEPFPHNVFDVGYVAVSGALALLARHLVPYASRSWAYVASLVGMLFSSGMFCLYLWVPVDRIAVLIASFVGGAAYGSFLLLNAEAFAGVSILRIVLYLSGSRVLASVVTWLLQSCDPLRLAPVLVILPVTALVLVRISHASLPASDRQRLGYPRYTFPWKLVALVAVFSFAYGLRQAELAPGAGQHSSFSTALAMGAVFLIVYFFPNRVDVAALCRAPVPLMMCGLLLVPVEGLLGGVASSYLVSISYTLMNLMVSVLFYDMAKRTGVAVVPLLGAMNAMQAFVVAGNMVSQILAQAPGGEGEASGIVTNVLVCVALVISFFLLFSERELAARWGVEVLREPSLGEGEARADLLAQRCDVLARTYGLTPREQEVLRELAHRKDNRAIAQNLLIAPGTLKAHTRHIYEKMGIHSRAELDGLLGL